MSRPLFIFRPNLQNKDHLQAWEILQGGPAGQEKAVGGQGSQETARKEELETTMRRVLREELQAAPCKPVPQQEETSPQEMMGFLDSLLGEE